MANPRVKTRIAQVTNEPEVPAPHVLCPSCDYHLTFLNSIVGGVRPIEHWDRYACSRCGGAFEYRRRTRKLRRTN
jgi:hypothetical protein